ncbi:MAG: diaminopimelate decarboxylase [Firmicutes bacterium]|nr:diaminopimelate decarboxylase [Bacillota bacterium]
MKINSLGHLTIGGCDTVELAKEFGTPLYVFDEEEVRNKAQAYLQAFAKLPDFEVIFAGKSFLTLGMCHLIDNLGLGLDVVSGGELYTALKAKFPVEKIYFHGNNKSKDELEMAIQAGIGRIVVDNLYELDLLAGLVKKHRCSADIYLRISPGVEAHTHTYIQTGQEDSKFGIPLAHDQALLAVKKAASIPGINLKGIHCHIGSQIFEVESFGVAIDIMVGFMKTALDHGIELTELDIGGGLGIRYTDKDVPVSIAEYGEAVVTELFKSAEKHGIRMPKLLVEPGRSIVGEAGTTLYTIGAIKDIPGVRTYVAVDGGMVDNPRVALYQAEYKAIVANKATQKANGVYSVAGKCCETGDMLIFDAELPILEPGDILAVLSTGAYNYSMSSNYNMLPRPAVVSVYEGNAELLVERETYEDLLTKHRVPERWLKTKIGV